jgi:hypothetical protein
MDIQDNVYLIPPDNRDDLVHRIQSISEGTFGGGNLRGPNIQPIAPA